MPTTRVVNRCSQHDLFASVAHPRAQDDVHARIRVHHVAHLANLQRERRVLERPSASAPVQIPLNPLPASRCCNRSPFSRRPRTSPRRSPPRRDSAAARRSPPLSSASASRARRRRRQSTNAMIAPSSRAARSSRARGRVEPAAHRSFIPSIHPPAVVVDAPFSRCARPRDRASSPVVDCPRA